MGYTLEFNCLLRITKTELEKIELVKDAPFVVEKEGERLYPLNIPLDFCDSDYNYLGKAVITKLSLEKGKTILTGKIIKIFSSEEARIYTDNFIAPSKLK